MTSRVAIITRTKDRPLLLERAIQSVLGQSLSDWRHVIVNDGGDAEALESLLDAHRESYGERLMVVHHGSSQGMQGAANAGISRSESTYVAIHDDDDSWDPRFLEATVGFLEKEGAESAYQGVITHTLQVEEKVTPKGKIKEVRRTSYLPLPEISLFRVGYENPFPPIAFCYRRSAYQKVGAYDARFTVAGDYDFNFRFLRKFEIGVVPEPLAFYHVRVSAQDSALENSVVTGVDEHKRRYNEFKNHYLRGGDSSLDPALAVGLNAAKFLVEIEWLAHEINRRAEKIEGVTEAASERIPTIEAEIARSLTLQDEAFRELMKHAQDPRLFDRLGVVTRDLSHLNESIGDVRKQNQSATEQQVHRQSAILDQLDSALSDLSYLNQLAGDIHKQIDSASEQLGATLRDLSYLNQFVGDFRKQSTEVAEQQVQRENAVLELLATTVRDLSYLNQLVGDFRAQTTENAEHHFQRVTSLSDRFEARAVDILREIQSHHTAMHEAMREKVLLQIGSFRIAWKKKRRPGPQES